MLLMRLVLQTSTRLALLIELAFLLLADKSVVRDFTERRSLRRDFFCTAADLVFTMFFRESVLISGLDSEDSTHSIGNALLFSSLSRAYGEDSDTYFSTSSCVTMLVSVAVGCRLANFLHCPKITFGRAD